MSWLESLRDTALLMLLCAVTLGFCFVLAWLIDTSKWWRKALAGLIFFGVFWGLIHFTGGVAK